MVAITNVRPTVGDDGFFLIKCQWSKKISWWYPQGVVIIIINALVELVIREHKWKLQPQPFSIGSCPGLSAVISSI